MTPTEKALLDYPRCPGCGLHMDEWNPEARASTPRFVCGHNNGERWMAYGDRPHEVIWHHNPNAEETFSHHTRDCGDFVLCKE